MGKTCCIQWIPAHVGIDGKEVAYTGSKSKKSQSLPLLKIHMALPDIKKNLCRKTIRYTHLYSTPTEHIQRSIENVSVPPEPSKRSTKKKSNNTTAKKRETQKILGKYRRRRLRLMMTRKKNHYFYIHLHSEKRRKKKQNWRCRRKCSPVRNDRLLGPKGRILPARAFNSRAAAIFSSPVPMGVIFE
ncbi:hypothetical protein TNCV_1298801 [Trichonephila clavipes]|nr:hypothetical protein TNCV_1298801 [Trichonephila clavipes]